MNTERDANELAGLMVEARSLLSIPRSVTVKIEDEMEVPAVIQATTQGETFLQGSMQIRVTDLVEALFKRSMAKRFVSLTQTCQAPWGCTRQTSKASIGVRRRIKDYELCHACFMYIWKAAKRTKESRETLIEKLPKQMQLPNRSIKNCQRLGCTNKLRDGQGHRRAGDANICRGCYDEVWRLSKTLEATIAEAYKQLPRKSYSLRKDESSGKRARIP